MLTCYRHVGGLGLCQKWSQLVKQHLGHVAHAWAQAQGQVGKGFHAMTNVCSAMLYWQVQHTGLGKDTQDVGVQSLRAISQSPGVRCAVWEVPE